MTDKAMRNCLRQAGIAAGLLTMLRRLIFGWATLKKQAASQMQKSGRSHRRCAIHLEMKSL
jgi:hypothetical protein